MYRQSDTPIGNGNRAKTPKPFAVPADGKPCIRLSTTNGRLKTSAPIAGRKWEKRNMELTELKRNLFKIFGVENIESLKTAIYNCCIENDTEKFVQQKNLCKLTINETVARNLGFDLDLYKNDCESGELQRIIQKLAGCKLLKSNYFTATKNKCEIKFENGSKNEISSVLIMIMNTWKQHIYFLNQEENRYLAELRDNLIGDLTSWKIDVNCGAKMDGKEK